MKDTVILGIDPGTNVMGYGLIHIQGNNLKLMHVGVLSMVKIEDHGIKLRMIFECVLQLIETYKPDEMAAEAPFFGKNVQSMLKLGRAQGVALAAALYRDIPIFEYSPRKIKQSITGKGAASKEQVAAMIQRILAMKDEEMPKYLDATDGLAAAICHHFQRKQASTSGKMGATKSGRSGGSSWKSFLADNPERIK
jgi:crossover junction endodeoxyribonuclease RuvC